MPGAAPAALDVRRKRHPAAADEARAAGQAAEEYGAVTKLSALVLSSVAKEDGAAFDDSGLPTAVTGRAPALAWVAGVQA